MTALQSKYSGWLIHLTAWAVIFGMPLFVTSPDRPLMTGSEYLRFLLVPLSFMVVFYTNYFLLIERYLFTRQTGRFLGGNALLDRKSTRLNSSHITRSRMPSSA